MRQIFRMRPWVQPAEPLPLAQIFKRLGRPASFPKGALMTHGGEDGDVGFLLSGLVAFSFIDFQGQSRIFNLCLPERTIGDLDGVNPSRVAVIAECLRPSTALLLNRKVWLAELRKSVELMELYADIAILKQECFLEGFVSNFTLDLSYRLRVLLLSIIMSYYPLKIDDWNPLPINLTITEISRIVAANRSWVSTKISEWERLGFMKKDGRRLVAHGSLFEPVRDWATRQKFGGVFSKKVDIPY